MRALFFIFIFFVSGTAVHASEKGNIIILFGTPCAGKSTLAKELGNTLPGNYQIVKKTDRTNALRSKTLMRVTGKSFHTTREILDVMLELPNEHQTELKKHSKTAYLATLEDVKEMSDRGENIILDVCLKKLIGMEAFEGYPVTKVLVYAPLSTLSFRERTRSLKNRSSSQVSRRRRKTILDFFCTLYQQCEKGDIPFDFVSYDDIEHYEKITSNKVRYQQLPQVLGEADKRYSFEESQWVGITPIVDHDLVVNTGINSVESCASEIKAYCGGFLDE